MSNLIKILLVDNLPLYLANLKSALEQLPDFQIIGDAENSFDAMKKAAKLRPDIILMDIEMAELSGIDAIRIIKQNHPDIKVIIITSQTDPKEVIQSLEAGADAYAINDINTDILLILIKSIKDGAFWLDPKIANIVREERPDIIFTR